MMSDKQTEELALYRQAINKIEDYFEYAYDSERDCTRVMDIVGDLSDELEHLYKGKQ
jgi:hypothetical protein